MEASTKYFNWIQEEVDIILWHMVERYGEYCRLEGKQAVKCSWLWRGCLNINLKTKKMESVIESVIEKEKRLDCKHKRLHNEVGGYSCRDCHGFIGMGWKVLYYIEPYFEDRLNKINTNEPLTKNTMTKEREEFLLVILKSQLRIEIAELNVWDKLYNDNFNGTKNETFPHKVKCEARISEIKNQIENIKLEIEFSKG